MKVTEALAIKAINELDEMEDKERKANRRRRLSHWRVGVYDYARWILRPAADGETDSSREYYFFSEYALNGAQSYDELSRSGNYYIYDEDVAKQLATDSERRYSKKDGTLLPPNGSEDWLAVQGRALYQAAELCIEAIQALQQRSGI